MGVTIDTLKYLQLLHLLSRNKQIINFNFNIKWKLTLPKSSSPSSTKPKVYLVNECKTSKQWILSPLAIGKSKLTNAKMFGLGIPRGESRLAMKSESWLKLMNWVAWGSYLKKKNKQDTLTNTLYSTIQCVFVFHKMFCENSNSQ